MKYKKQQLVELQNILYTSGNPTRRWLHCTRRDWIVNTIKELSKQKNNAALEIGPGSGIYLPVLAELYGSVAAVDIEEAYLAEAKELEKDIPNLSSRLDNILNSELPDACFDLILCTEVVEHISNSKRAIAEMYRLLRPGGFLLLSTPQRYSPLELTAKIAFLPGFIQLVKLIYREPILETGHINLLTERQIVDQLETSGFEIIEQCKSGLYIPLVAEFMGTSGLRIEQWLEGILKDSTLDHILWTQYYIAQA